MPTEHAQNRRPVANWLIIGLTTLTGLLLMSGLDTWQSEPPLGSGESQSGLLGWLILQRGDGFHPVQLLGHTLVHLDWFHLVSNLFVLIVVGNPVNTRLGNLRYVSLYLLTALAGGLAWLAFGSGAAAVGASGAIMGIAGLFLVLYPVLRVRVAAFLPGLALWAVALLAALFDLPLGVELLVFALALSVASVIYALRSAQGSSELLAALVGFRCVFVSGFLLVGLAIAADVTAVVRGSSTGIAHSAHIAGALSGCVAGVVLATFWIQGTENEPTLLEALGLKTAAPAAPRPTVVVVPPTRRTSRPTSFARRARPPRTQRLVGRPRRRRAPSFGQWVAQTQRLNTAAGRADAAA